MIAQTVLIALSLLASVNAQTCTVAYDAPDNSTVVHSVYFDTLGSGSDSAVYVGNDGTITFTAKVSILNSLP
jgi:hypothetical protein